VDHVDRLVDVERHRCRRRGIARAIDVDQRAQGNRVSWSLGDEADEEVVVPSGDFAFEAHGVFGR
jgi:hypothetical protein